MSEFDNVMEGDGCRPTGPCEPPSQQEECEAVLEGTVKGVIRMECCCPQLKTRTFVLNIGPQSEASLQAFLQTTVSNYEAAGYLIMAHSLIDTGAGWTLGLTIGYYV